MQRLDIKKLGIKEAINYLDTVLFNWISVHSVGKDIIETKLVPNDNSHLTVDISGWSSGEKNLLFNNILKGIDYFHFDYRDQQGFCLGTYNSLKEAWQGAHEVQLYLNGIKWFDPVIKK